MFNEEIVKPENLVYKKTDVLTDAVMPPLSQAGKNRRGYPY